MKLRDHAAPDQRIALRYPITGMHVESKTYLSHHFKLAGGNRDRGPQEIVQREVVQDRHDGPDHSRFSASRVFAQSRVRG